LEFSWTHDKGRSESSHWTSQSPPAIYVALNSAQDHKKPNALKINHPLLTGPHVGDFIETGFDREQIFGAKV
jgi:hypothetical protein